MRVNYISFIFVTRVSAFAGETTWRLLLDRRRHVRSSCDSRAQTTKPSYVHTTYLCPPQEIAIAY